MQNRDQSPPIWRILAVGWGTFVGTAAMAFFKIMDGPVTPGYLAELGLYSLGYGSVFAVVIAVPMLALWTRIYPGLRRKVGSARTASCLTAAVTAAIGMLLLAVLVGAASASFPGGMGKVLPWAPVPVALAGVLAWLVMESRGD